MEEEKKAEHIVYLKQEAEISRNSAGEKVLNEYVLLEKIGEGSFSKVKRVKHIVAEEEREFAMKIMHKSALKREWAFTSEKDGSSKMTNNLEKVYNEIDIWSTIDHPYIIKLYEIIDDISDDNLYLVMDIADMGQIAHWNKEGGKYRRSDNVVNWILANKLSEKKFEKEQDKIEAVSKIVFRQIFESINYLHNKNIVHRDIKPDNILFSSKEGCVKITDFTVSKQLVDPTEVCFDFEGTAGFSAPECASDIDGYLPKPTDIWSLGICLYTFVGELVPFYAENKYEMQSNAQNKDIAIPLSFSPNLSDLITKMVSKSPSMRPTISEVLSHPWLTS